MKNKVINNVTVSNSVNNAGLNKELPNISTRPLLGGPNLNIGRDNT